VQYGALAAFSGNEDVEEYIRTCTHIHKMVSGYVRECVVELGIEYPQIDGGFYLYPDFGEYKEWLQGKGITTSEALAENLLENARVSTLPGTVFGDYPDNLRLRLSVCDYQGEAALDALVSNPGIQVEKLVEECCPKIKEGCERLVNYFKG
jgi:aspartate/methionine/tyrosine aminotransferase